MANVNITFNGKEFLLSCDDGQEEHLIELAEQLNNKFVNLKSKLGNIGENKLLLITSVKVMDEYFETKKKIEEKKKELNDLTNKFKEKRSLVFILGGNNYETIAYYVGLVRSKSVIVLFLTCFSRFCDKSSASVFFSLRFLFRLFR